MRDLPLRQIWLTPHCDKCRHEAEVLWCEDNSFDPCEDCGKEGIRYALDKRYLPRLQKAARP